MCFCYLRSENRDPQVCQRFKLTRFHLTQSMSSGGETSRWRTGKVAKRHVIVHTGVRSKIPRMIVSMLQVCQQRNGLHRIVCCRHIRLSASRWRCPRPCPSWGNGSDIRRSRSEDQRCILPDKSSSRWWTETAYARCWRGLENSVINDAINEWRKRIRARIRVKGGHLKAFMLTQELTYDFLILWTLKVNGCYWVRHVRVLLFLTFCTSQVCSSDTFKMWWEA